jgi:hypothetical protein
MITNERTSIATWICALAVTTALGGCSSESASSSANGDDAEGALKTSTSIEAATYQLRDDPSAHPDPQCDRYTELALRSDGSAKLTNKLGGTCELFVEADARTYHVKRLADDCGSRVYAGQTNDGDDIKITDNRTRTCENMIAATIVVEEHRHGAAHTLYWSYGTSSP